MINESKLTYIIPLSKAFYKIKSGFKSNRLPYLKIMFIGHFAVGFAGKSVAPKTSLGTLFLAAQLLDLLWPTLLLFQVEQVKINTEAGKFPPLVFTNYPYSHSLALVLIWGLLFALAYWLLRKDKRAAWVLGLLVISHWFLDLIVHIPDLPLLPGDSPLLGLGLWKSVAGTLLLEGALFIWGLMLYLKTTTAKNKIGLYSFWSLVFFLVFIYIGNLFGPVPDKVSDIAWAGQLQWLLVIWGHWTDHNRKPLKARISTLPVN